jgi:transcriptional regulator with XRE-family HTH domain
MNQTVKELRKSLKLTQGEFADKIGVAQSMIARAESGLVSDLVKDKIESQFRIKLIIPDKPKESSSIEDMLLRIEQIFEKEIEFLKLQIERKDKMLDALTEKLVKVEVANWPPMFPTAGELGLVTEVQLRAA